MAHKEFKQIVNGADNAILFIHGIAGTPDHFAPFLSFVPEHISVWNLLLEGHGGSVKDFSSASMAKWEQQVKQAVKELSNGHSRIYIVAHSMGTLFSIEQALRTPKIKGLFLLSVPLSLSLKPRLIRNCVNVYFDRISPDDHWTLAAKRCYGIGKSINPLHYIGWAPRYWELFQKIWQIRRILSYLTTKTYCYQSEKDEMVSLRSIDLLTRNPHICVKKLENSGHFYYPDVILSFLSEEFKRFINSSI